MTNALVFIPNTLIHQRILISLSLYRTPMMVRQGKSPQSKSNSYDHWKMFLSNIGFLCFLRARPHAHTIPPTPTTPYTYCPPIIERERQPSNPCLNLKGRVE